MASTSISEPRPTITRFTTASDVELPSYFPRDHRDHESLRPAISQPGSRDGPLTGSDRPHEFSEALPPADGGRDAWLVLFSCFILEALVWGFPFSFGVFNEYYSTYEPFASDAANIAAIGTTATGIMYFSAPLVYALLRNFPSYRKTSAVLGYIILLTGLLAASFANTVPQLLATQGILYAVGGSFHYFPAFLYLDEWFVARKGVAYGLVWAGAGASGVAIPLTMQWVLSRWGFRTALRVWTVVSVVLTTPALVCMKGRLPVQHADMGKRAGVREVSMGYLRSPAFWFLQLGNVLSSLGYFMPSLYMPSFAVSMGWSALSGTIAVSICNGFNVLGYTFFGWLSDWYHVTTVLNISALGTAASVFLFWSFAVYEPVLYVFAVLYGTFATGFAATWARCTGPIRETYTAAETGMVIALFSAGKGIGAVVGGPLSGALIRSDVWLKSNGAFAFGSGYGSLIVFSGVTACFATIGWFGKKCGMFGTGPAHH